MYRYVSLNYRASTIYIILEGQCNNADVTDIAIFLLCSLFQCKYGVLGVSPEEGEIFDHQKAIFSSLFWGLKNIF